jgi:sulfatase modifying factor 1
VIGAFVWALLGCLARAEAPVVTAEEPSESPSLGRMVWVGPGVATLGSRVSEPGRKRDEHQHAVRLTRGFWMMDHEVTQGEWFAVMGTRPVAAGEVRVGGSTLGACAHVGVGDTLPVACVSWEDAAAFAARVSERDGVRYRLPTEAEWEFAARDGDGAAWAAASRLEDVCAAGNVANRGRAAEFEALDTRLPERSAACDDGFTALAPVRSFRPTARGLYDMSGNVMEWVADGEGRPYPRGGEIVDPVGPEDEARRVLRGGAWSLAPEQARLADRSAAAPRTARYDDLGFRLIRESP